MNYKPHPERYHSMPYARVGKSGLKLPRISLGLWHNFGGVDDPGTAIKMLTRAFDLGVCHFDLANNYGPPAGSAEETLGRALKNEFSGLRDELCISSKAGWHMWDGPYGDFGSRKYLISSLDQSLKRLGIEYVDIFYHHRPDPDTPLEESMGALSQIVKSGKALYVGISSYSPEDTARAAQLLRQAGTPCLLHQPAYNLFHREPEQGLLATLKQEEMGCIVFSPLAQGMLTDRYLHEIPKDSRAEKSHGFLQKSELTDARLKKIRALSSVAESRGQTLAQMAIAWTLRDEVVTSAILGASRVNQIEDCLAAVNNTAFSPEELTRIDAILGTES